MQQEQQATPQKKTRDFQDILKRERTQRGWSQADVAEKIGSDPKTVGRWERGVTFPSPYMCQQLSNLYGKSVQELRLIRDEISPPIAAEVTNEQDPPIQIAPAKEEMIQATPHEKWTFSYKRWSKRQIFISVGAFIALLLLVTIVLQLSFSRSTAASMPATKHISNNPYANSGTLVLHETLAIDSASGWSLNKNDQGQCFFADGSYRIRDIQNGFMEVCLANETYFTNFTYEVKATMQTGDCGGVVFRSTFPLLYYFLSCSDGSYRFVRYDKDNSANRRIIAAGTSPAIQQGLKVSNILAVVAVGTTFEIYVNHTRVVRGTDAAYFDGQIGMIAHTCRMIYPDARPNLCDAPTEVSFNDVRVWKM